MRYKHINTLITSVVKYVSNVTIHGVVMIFFAVMPFLISGKGNLIMPLIVGVDEVILPRINNISILLLLVSGIVVTLVVYSKSNVANGWTIYPPLCTLNNCTTPITLTYVIIALLISGTSSTLTSINLIVTVLVYKVHCTLNNTSLYVYTMLTTVGLLVLVLPVLTVILILIITDLSMNSNIYNNSKGGDTLIYQHLFWFFGHPEVYILILPTFGVMSIALSNYIGNLQVMVINTLSIGAIGLQVWAHHMYTSSINIDTRAYHNTTTLLIGIPTAAKVYSYLLCI